MEDLILISNLNDFIFCPVSIYFHKLYGNQDNLTYFDNVQWNGRKPRIKNDYINVTLDIGYTILFNIVDAIEERFGESEEHIIVTHDSVRPFVTLRIIEENIAAAVEFGACDTVIGAVDTIVVSEDGKMITEIPDRKKMFQGQTPQSFRMSMIKKLYYDLTDAEKSILTDACKICVVRNVPVKLVRGEVSNLKITTIDDMKMAKAMI